MHLVLDVVLLLLQAVLRRFGYSRSESEIETIETNCACFRFFKSLPPLTELYIVPLHISSPQLCSSS